MLMGVVLHEVRFKEGRCGYKYIEYNHTFKNHITIPWFGLDWVRTGWVWFGLDRFGLESS